MSVGIAFDGESDVEMRHVVGEVGSDEVIVDCVGYIGGKKETVGICLADE